jgi:hypothetical protein
LFGGPEEKPVAKIADFGFSREISEKYYVPSRAELCPWKWTAPVATFAAIGIIMLFMNCSIGSIVGGQVFVLK